MAQNPKGGGLSSTFGGSTAQFGVQRTNDFMEKATWVLASVIIVLIFLSVILTAKPAANYNDAPVKKEKQLQLHRRQLKKLLIFLLRSN